MWVSSIHLRNIKSFSDSGTITLSKGITVLLGASNVGKSIPIKALFMLQEATAAIRPDDLRVGQNTGEIIIDLEAISEDGYEFININKDSFVDASSGKIDIKFGYADNDLNNPQIQGTVEIGGLINFPLLVAADSSVTLSQKTLFIPFSQNEKL